MYPAPCQSRCIYCNIPNENQSVTGDAAKTACEKLFDMLDLAERCGILAPNAVWQVSSGEIAIHPYHDRIMKLVQGKAAAFYTNCMKFDEAVAQNLHDNPNSTINLSVDSGTRETWKKSKVLTTDMFSYSQEEQSEAVQSANEVLQRGLV